MTPKQREILFDCADNLEISPFTLGKLGFKDIYYLVFNSLIFKVDFFTFFFDSVDNVKKLLDNISQMKKIFEKKDGRNHRVLNYSNMTQEQRDLATESSKKRRQEFTELLTAEELKESDEQFKRLFNTLEEARN